jgi:hypothetical protein
MARAEAKRLISLAWYPAGARRLSTWIRLKGYELSGPGGSIGDPDQEDITRFYLAGPKSQGVSWLNARTPDGGTLDGEGGADRANLEWSYSFRSTSILGQSDLQYSKRILPDGDVEFRIDAQVAWTPMKSLFSLIPAGATLVDAIYTPGDYPMTPASKRLTASTTSVQTISTIRRQINALPVAYPGIESCPFEGTASITVRFYDSAHERPSQTVYFASSSCGRIEVSQFSPTHHLVGSGEDGGGFESVPAVTQLLGLGPTVIH